MLSCTRIAALTLVVSLPCLALAQPIAARRPQQTMRRAFLMKTPDGKTIATAEETAQVQGDTVHSRMTFRFRDGSLDDEQSIFTQDKVFHLVSDHHVQKGPSFPTPQNIAVDVPAGTVTWHEEKGGRDEAHTARVSLPGDLANGIMPLLVENFPASAQEMQTSWVAVPTHPMVVDISVKPAGDQNMDPDGRTVRAREFVLHPELHGFVSFLAPLVNKVPGDIHIWVTDTARPDFVKLAGPFYQGGPIWTVEPTGPPTP